MDKQIIITIKLTPEGEQAEINIKGANSEQSTFLTSKLLKIMDELKDLQGAKY